jgi:hypothetical protein
MTPDDGKTLFLFVAWVTQHGDLKILQQCFLKLYLLTPPMLPMWRDDHCVFVPELLQHNEFYCFYAFVPSGCEWVWVWVLMYCYTVDIQLLPIPALLENEVISRIKQINTDGDRKKYEPLTKLSLDENSPWYGVNHCLCAYHTIEQLFKTKVYVNDKNKAFVEYTKRWV